MQNLFIHASFILDMRLILVTLNLTGHSLFDHVHPKRRLASPTMYKNVKSQLNSFAIKIQQIKIQQIIEYHDLKPHISSYKVTCSFPKY